jgi:hypothetical protein
MSPVGSVLPRARDPLAWEWTLGIFAFLIAAALPWSTSLVTIFVVGWPDSTRVHARPQKLRVNSQTLYLRAANYAVRARCYDPTPHGARALTR